MLTTLKIVKFRVACSHNYSKLIINTQLLVNDDLPKINFILENNLHAKASSVCVIQIGLVKPGQVGAKGGAAGNRPRKGQRCIAWVARSVRGQILPGPGKDGLLTEVIAPEQEKLVR